MSNQLEQSAMTLAQMLADNRLTKTAGDQQIKHTSLTAQHSLGEEQQREVDGLLGSVAATNPSNANTVHDRVQEYPNCQSLNRPAAAALSNYGTGINHMNVKGKACRMPKCASDYTTQLAGILHQMNKRAALEAPQSACSLLTKIANCQTSYDDAEVVMGINKLAAHNPVFAQLREDCFMRKLAEDVAELAEAEGIPEEAAAEVMDAAAAEDPGIIDEALAEADVDALAEEAEAEDDAMVLEGMAANASANLGADISAVDIADAIEEVQAAAEEMGVPPEALIEAAMEDMTAGDEISEEDMAAAEALQEEAAAAGISPEELIQMAADDMGGEDPGIAKEASYGFYSPRAAYVSQLLHQ